MKGVSIVVDGKDVQTRDGVSVAAALVSRDLLNFRTSVSGARRGPVCGMGTCFECRVTIDGDAHVRACMTLVREGMIVETAGHVPDSGGVAR